MKYNFDKCANKRNTNSLKWDEDKTIDLPLWVADMDFECDENIIAAIQKKLDVKSYGYTIIPDEFYTSIQGWWIRHHHFKFETNCMIYSTGVVASISSCVRKLTTPGENVLIQSPVYNIFTNCIVNNGRNLVSSDLVYDGNGHYTVDWADLEKKMQNPQTSLMILCNPQNPTGHIWTKNELDRIGKMAYQNHIIVVSDEIHCDCVNPGCEYIPFASVNEVNLKNSVTLVSTGKAFNLAGLHTSVAIVADENLRHKVWRQINTDECGEPNFFAVEASIAAFSKGDIWVKECMEYIYKNKLYVKAFIKENLPKVIVASEEATYLYWIDLSSYQNTLKDKSFSDYLKESTHLWVSDGSQYGGNGKNFIRINLATSFSNVKEAMNQLKQALDLLK